VSEKAPAGKRDGATNGAPLSVAALAAAKRLDPDWLRGELGVEDLPGGGVAIPYYDETGAELFSRERGRPGGPRFRQPAGVPLRPYGLWRLDGARREGRVFLAEGESDAWALWSAGLPALAVPGAGACGCLTAEDLCGVEAAYACPDNDAAGKEMAAALAARLGAVGYGGRLYSVTLPAGVKDVSDLCRDDPAGFASRWRQLTEAAAPLFVRRSGQAAPGNGRADRVPAAPPPGLVSATVADLRPRPVRWVVPRYLPLGKVVLVAGDGGHGKSTLALHVAACLSRGVCAFGLDYADAPAGETLLIQCEDDWEDTVLPRLLALGADVRHVHRLVGVRSADGRLSPFTLAHFQELDLKLEECPAIKLVVIDPAGAYVGAGVDDHRDSELRALLGPLAELAARRGVTVLLVKHFCKAPAVKAVVKIGGSTGYVNSVRAAFVVLPDREDEDRALLLPAKFNVGRKPKGLAFRRAGLTAGQLEEMLRPYEELGEGDRERIGETAFRLEWEGEVDVTADEQLAEGQRAERGPSKVERCVAWLREFLKEHAHPSDEIAAAAKKAGFTFDNQKEAKAHLKGEGLCSSKDGFRGEWWCGFGDPAAWKRRPDKGAPPPFPSFPSLEKQGENPQAPPKGGKEGKGGSGPDPPDGGEAEGLDRRSREAFPQEDDADAPAP
jgi:hypothetical protein